jgi:hypothetical protein
MMVAAGLLLGVGPREAAALDKQGSAHGGGVEGADAGFAVSGALSYGVSLYNPTYAARPDNTGLALFRYAAHLDFDLIGRRLSLPLDLNLFTDRERKGAKKLSPTEFDVISGVTSTLTLGKVGALELGTRVEHDRELQAAPRDAARPSCGNGALCSQTYVDARARLLYSFADAYPDLGRALHDGDVSGWLTLGVFAWNPSYAARPDNTGKALFRYGAHTELSFFDDVISVGLDGVMFSDRQKNVVRPSELDLTPELIGHLPPFELHLAYERDMPLDRRGLTQSFVYLLGVWSFDATRPTTKPLEHRGQIVSP